MDFTTIFIGLCLVFTGGLAAAPIAFCYGKTVARLEIFESQRPIMPPQAVRNYKAQEEREYARNHRFVN